MSRRWWFDTFISLVFLASLAGFAAGLYALIMNNSTRVGARAAAVAGKHEELSPRVQALVADLRMIPNLATLNDTPSNCTLSGKRRRYAHCDFSAGHIDVRLGWKVYNGTPNGLSLHLRGHKDAADFPWIDLAAVLRTCPDLPPEDAPTRAAEMLAAQKAAVWRLSPSEPGTVHMTDGATRFTSHEIGACRLSLGERAWIGGLRAEVIINTGNLALRRL